LGTVWSGFLALVEQSFSLLETGEFQGSKAKCRVENSFHAFYCLLEFHQA
jgi:hypothetical protein